MSALSAVMLVAVASGCSTGEEPVSSPEPTVPVVTTSAAPDNSWTPSESPKPSPRPSNTWDEEQAAAADTVLQFFHADQ